MSERVASSKCNKHGYTEDVVGGSRNKFRCRPCEYERHAKWRKKEENRIKRVSWAKRYQENNPEKMEKHREIILLRSKLKHLEAKKNKVLTRLDKPHVECKKHGYTEDIQDTKKKTTWGVPKYRCRLCHNESNRERRRKKQLTLNAQHLL